MNATQRAMRFAWRLARNVIAASPARSVLFRPSLLAKAFGRSDCAYAVDVFLHHAGLLARVEHTRPTSVLEIGPGANVGTALLWACLWREAPPEILLWDRFPNLDFKNIDWAGLAQGVSEELRGRPQAFPLKISVEELHRSLNEIASRTRRPPIRYVVGPQRVLQGIGRAKFDFVYSHAALEHVWKIDELYVIIGTLTSPNGIHSHRIDLCDHGQRDLNYLEMCEWSNGAWWLSQRFIPGGINRWRAVQHLDALRKSGLEAMDIQRTLAPCLPVARERLASGFRDFSETELRTRAIDVVARKSGRRSSV